MNKALFVFTACAVIQVLYYLFFLLLILWYMVLLEVPIMNRFFWTVLGLLLSVIGVYCAFNMFIMSYYYIKFL